MVRAAATRVGVLGGGFIGSRHLRNLAGFDDVRIVAVADPILERAEAAASNVGATAYADYRTMLERETLDALYICVPPFAHGGPELAALERGLPFFVEKPLACDLETAEAIARSLDRGNLVTAVGYHWRYLDTTEEAHRLLREKPARLVTGYWLDTVPPVGWWAKESLSGGQLVEQATHIFDLARVLVGDATEIFAMAGRWERGDVPECDIANASVVSLRFASGAIGAIVSTCELRWRHRVGLHLFCEAMAIELGEFELIVDVGRGRPVRSAEGDPFVREDRDFIDAVQGKPNRIRTPYREALQTHRLTLAAARSAREGIPLSLPLATAISR